MTMVRPDLMEQRLKRILDEFQQLQRTVVQSNADFHEQRREQRQKVIELDAWFKDTVTRLRVELMDAEGSVAGASDAMKHPEFYAYELFRVILIGITEGSKFLRRSHQELSQQSVA